MRQGFAILSRVDHPPILLGTSSFTAAGWEGSLYPQAAGGSSAATASIRVTDAYETDLDQTFGNTARHVAT
jgi:hypothetical protein